MVANEATDALGDKRWWKVVREKSHRGSSWRWQGRGLVQLQHAMQLRDASATAVNKHFVRVTRKCDAYGTEGTVSALLYAIARSNRPNEVADFRNLLSNGPRFNCSTVLNVNREKNGAANERSWDEREQEDRENPRRGKKSRIQQFMTVSFLSFLFTYY